jgi:hypothetical protein
MVNSNAWARKAKSALDFTHAHNMGGLMKKIPVNKQSFTLQLGLKESLIKLPPRLRHMSHQTTLRRKLLKD